MDKDYSIYALEIIITIIMAIKARELALDIPGDEHTQFITNSKWTNLLIAAACIIMAMVTFGKSCGTSSSDMHLKFQMMILLIMLLTSSIFGWIAWAKQGKDSTCGTSSTMEKTMYSIIAIVAMIAGSIDLMSRT